MLSAVKFQNSKRYFVPSEVEKLFLQQLADKRLPGPWLLPSVKGGPFDYKNFQSRHWKPLVEKLVSDRKVAFYFSEYHARHTFITELVKKGIDEQDISYICRTSVAMIQRCYASQSRNVSVPEF